MHLALGGRAGTSSAAQAALKEDQLRQIAQGAAVLSALCLLPEAWLIVAAAMWQAAWHAGPQAPCCLQQACAVCFGQVVVHRLVRFLMVAAELLPVLSTALPLQFAVVLVALAAAPAWREIVRLTR